MGLGEAVTVAGIGCRRGVSVAAVLAAVEAARGGRRLDALATVPAKRGEPALAEAARRLGLPLLVGAVADGDPRLAQPLGGVAGGDRQRARPRRRRRWRRPGRRRGCVGPRLALGPVTCAIAVAEGGA